MRFTVRPASSILRELEAFEQLAVPLHQVGEVGGLQQADPDLRAAVVLLLPGREGEDGAGEVVGVAGQGERTRMVAVS